MKRNEYAKKRKEPFDETVARLERLPRPGDVVILYWRFRVVHRRTTWSWVLVRMEPHFITRKRTGGMFREYIKDLVLFALRDLTICWIRRDPFGTRAGLAGEKGELTETAKKVQMFIMCSWIPVQIWFAIYIAWPGLFALGEWLRDLGVVFGC